MTIISILGWIFFGFVLGRLYGWMKYHYPEFQEEIHLRVARKRAERYRHEYETEKIRGQIDDDLDRRLNR